MAGHPRPATSGGGTLSPPGRHGGRLVAQAFRLDADVDLVSVGAAPGAALWLQGGAGFAGQGVAATIAVAASERGDAHRHVAAQLAAIELAAGYDPAAPLPRAIGALPYDPTAGASLVIPARTVHRQADGARWVVAIEHDAPPSASPVIVTVPDGEAPTSFVVQPCRPPAWWRNLIAETTARIRAGELRKVVLARAIEVTADVPIDPRLLLRRLALTYPTCFLAHVEGFVCASPELLVSRHGDVVRAHPMAGTAPRLGDPAADAQLAARLLANASYRHEHQLTIDMVHDTLLDWSSYLDAEPEPTVVAVANVQHLATLVEGRLSRPEPSVLELVGALHPTPAVGGDPRDVALELQAHCEQLDRGRYGGPVGWVDQAGNGEWAVGIRSAELAGNVARLYAGNGIVADSDPATEFAETQAKLQALLGALIRP